MQVPLSIIILSFFLIRCSTEIAQSRLSVVFYGSDWIDQSLVVRCENNIGSLYWSVVPRRNFTTGFKSNTIWTKIPLKEGVACFSNPVSVLQSDNSTFISFQASDGQVYSNYFTADFKLGDWLHIGGNLSHDEGAVLKGFDGVSVQDFQGYLYIFARSFTNSSHLYWSAFDKVKHTSTLWSMVGDGTKLATDAAVAFNSFTKLLEAFMVGTDGYLYRSWQLSFGKWSSWDKTGWSAPHTYHAPVVHSMSSNMYNGQLNVFIHGTDGKLYHIWQTTCDKVPNPWGWCTWSTWNQIGNAIPKIDVSVTNTLSIGHNIHLGIELFVVDTTGQLYKLWQSERHGTWSNWQLVQDTHRYQIQSLPAIVDDGTGWWSAYTLDTSVNVLIVQQNRSLTLQPNTVITESSLTAVWDMPADEASNKDWIGIIPLGASNHFYVDYVYVGGSQNPMSEVIPSGNVTFITYLPKGQYNVRYLVDKRFVSAAGTTLIVTDSPIELEWEQIFKGLFIGLNIKGVDVKVCVKDAENIPDDFTKALTDFQDREIFTGLFTLGTVLLDVINATKDCGIEEEFIDRIETFAKDLEACVVQKQCTHFVVDLGKEIVVLYENIYEIYADIIAASNSFKIQAFTQGGVNVGRVIAACIALPRESIEPPPQAIVF